MTPFRNLTDGSGQQKKRLREGRLALSAVAGGDGSVVPLASAICGWDNLTTSSIVKVFNSLSFPTHPTHAQRTVQVALLSPLSHLSHEQLRSLGLNAGKALLESAREWALCPGDAVSDARGRNPGRLMAGAPGVIAEDWASASYVSSRSGKRVLYGSVDQHAKRIARDHSVSVSTAKRRKPSEVTPAARATDLCGVCEQLRSQRLHFARACGKGFPEASLGEGTCTMARQLVAEIKEEEYAGNSTAVKLLAIIHAWSRAQG